MKRYKAYIPKPEKITIKKKKKSTTLPKYFFIHSVYDKSKTEKVINLFTNLKKQHADQNNL